MLSWVGGGLGWGRARVGSVGWATRMVDERMGGWVGWWVGGWVGGWMDWAEKGGRRGGGGYSFVACEGH